MRDPKDKIRDELIWLGCRRGDEESFRSLVRHWEQPLFYYLRRLLEREEDAWDTLQEVWLRAFRGIASLRTPDALGAWLYRIARNAAMNHLTRVPEWVRLDEESEGSAASTAESGPQDERELTAGYSARDIHLALPRLPGPEREVLTLFFLEGFAVGEIAGVVGVPPGTVKSRMHRAKAQLRRLLEEGRK